MCGIAGVVHSEQSLPVPSGLIQTMCDTLATRGPDHFGSYVKDNIGIGMRRLSIIDLQTGDQPMTNEDETVWIVFNGEIYNYQSLRGDLETRGHRFRTTSDTEVIVHLYEELGTDCVQRLRGMFAFAIWDSRQRILVLGRDRLGIKPLYYAVTSDGLIFGSELKAIMAHPAMSRDIDLSAVSEYFIHLCVPGDLSIFKQVRKVPPAHVLTFSQGKVNVTRYWHIQPNPDEKMTEAEWVEGLRAHLRQAIESHMIADVPVGAFLSGGLDSGALVAVMSGSSKKSAAVKTFTVGFATDVGRFDERVAARTVAERYHTDHYECVLEANVADLLPKLVRTFDEPFADSSAIPNWLVCQETARHVKVVLSGLGGDELFGGYERYLGLQRAQDYRNLPGWTKVILRGLVRSGLAGRGFSSWSDRLNRFVLASELPLLEQYRSFIAAFDDPEALFRPDVHGGLRSRVSRYEEVVSELTIANPVDLGLFADLYLYLPDDLLTLTDRVSMAHSLEVRVPFLDHELVEFAARIPARLKLHGNQKKYLLRLAIADWLPKEHFGLPKQGFSIPLASWLRGALKPLLLDLLASRECQQSPWLNNVVVQRLASEHLSGKRNHEIRLWAILCFLEWQRQFASSATTQVPAI